MWSILRTWRSAMWTSVELARSIGRPRDARLISIRHRVALATLRTFAAVGVRPEPGQWTGTRAAATAVTDGTGPIKIRPNSDAHSPLSDLKLIKGSVQAFLQAAG